MRSGGQGEARRRAGLQQPFGRLQPGMVARPPVCSPVVWVLRSQTATSGGGGGGGEGRCHTRGGGRTGAASVVARRQRPGGVALYIFSSLFLICCHVLPPPPCAPLRPRGRWGALSGYASQQYCAGAFGGWLLGGGGCAGGPPGRRGAAGRAGGRTGGRAGGRAGRPWPRGLPHPRWRGGVPRASPLLGAAWNRVGGDGGEPRPLVGAAGWYCTWRGGGGGAGCGRAAWRLAGAFGRLWPVSALGRAGAQGERVGGLGRGGGGDGRRARYGWSCAVSVFRLRAWWPGSGARGAAPASGRRIVSTTVVVVCLPPGRCFFRW